MAAAVAMANLDVFENEHLLENVRTNEPKLRGMLEGLRDLPIVGDVRGAGYFQAIELVKDKDDQGIRSTTRSPRRSCAASSPASCTAAV